jgi:hypothetical protein
VLERILTEGRAKAPLKYVESIDLEEFTLGLVPPRFHVCHARFNPAKNYLQLELDMTFQSSGLQCVVRTLCRALGVAAASIACARRSLRAMHADRQTGRQTGELDVQRRRRRPLIAP